MTQRLKIMTVLGTRPEIIRLSRVMSLLDEHVHHVLVHTGQNADFELNDAFFRDLEVRPPDYFLNIDRSSLGRILGDVLIKSKLLLAVLFVSFEVEGLVGLQVGGAAVLRLAAVTLQQVIDGEAEATGQIADATAERQAGHPGGGEEAGRGGHTELHGRVVDVAPGAAEGLSPPLQ